MSGVEFLPQEAPIVPSAATATPPSESRGARMGRAQRPPAAGPLLWGRSLASRLVAGVVALVVVLVLAIGASTYYALRSFLYNRLDQQLAVTASPRSIVSLISPDTPLGNGVEVPQTVFVVIVRDSTGKPFSDQPVGRDVTGLKLPAAALKRLAGRDTAPASVRTLDGQIVRIRSVSGFTTSGSAPDQAVTVLVGLSEADVHRTLSRTINAELIIGLLAVLVAFLTTAIGVRLSLRRLKRVTATAQEVATELSPTGTGLERRVPEGDSTTEVGQLAQSFNTMLAAVETQFAARLASEQRMRQFLADASHELRTPLTSIRGFAELARMQRAAAGVAATHEDDNLDRIESEGTRMSRLVDDLLLLARDESDGAQPAARELVDLGPLLDDVVAGSRAAFPDRRITLDELRPLPPVVGDRDQLIRVVRNLVTNAAVHTAPERPIEVRAFFDSGGAVVTVRDGGPGLPPEQAAHVFERFWRADKARTRARGGSGLGMSIVAAIVRAHGGTVRFDSTVEGGSTVTLWLPAGLDEPFAADD